MSKKNIDSLNGFYTNSKIQTNRISAEDVGAKHIGHFGFFKDMFKESLWERYLLQELD